MLSLFRFLLASSSMLLLAPEALAQRFDNLVPAAASPGDLLRIEGAGLSQVTGLRVRFSFVEGFQIVTLEETVAVTVVDDTLLLAVVPDLPNTGPYPDGLSGIAVSTLETATGDLFPSKALVLYEVSNGRVSSVGEGSTQSTGQGRAVTTVRPSDGIPFRSSSFADIELVNARPGATALLVRAPLFRHTVPCARGRDARRSAGQPAVRWAPANRQSRRQGHRDMARVGDQHHGLSPVGLP